MCDAIARTQMLERRSGGYHGVSGTAFVAGRRSVLMTGM